MVNTDIQLIRKLVVALDDAALGYRLMSPHATRPYLGALLGRIAHTHDQIAVDLDRALGRTHVHKGRDRDRTSVSRRISELVQRGTAEQSDGPLLADAAASEKRIAGLCEKALAVTGDADLQQQLRRNLDEIRDCHASIEHLKESVAVHAADRAATGDGSGYSMPDSSDPPGLSAHPADLEQLPQGS
ncbi:MAG: hypothetical protein WBV61_01015 [Rhodanobacteraceae bacterium]